MVIVHPVVLALSEYPYNTQITLEWVDGLSIEGTIFTFFETYNLEDPEEEGYMEYHAAAIKTTKILHPESAPPWAVVGEWFEIGPHNAPFKVTLRDGTVIYEETP